MAVRYIPIVVSLTPDQLKRLEDVTRQSRFSRAEIIRTAIDEWLTKKEGENREIIL